MNKRQIDTEGVHVLLVAEDRATHLRPVGGATYLLAVNDGTLLPTRYICRVQFNVFLEMPGNRRYWDTG